MPAVTSAATGVQYDPYTPYEPGCNDARRASALASPPTSPLPAPPPAPPPPPDGSMRIGAQLERLVARDGLNFRVMLVGKSGLGKSTFKRALFRPFVPEAQVAEDERQSGTPLRRKTGSIVRVLSAQDGDAA